MDGSVVSEGTIGNLISRFQSSTKSLLKIPTSMHDACNWKINSLERVQEFKRFTRSWIQRVQMRNVSLSQIIRLQSINVYFFLSRDRSNYTQQL